MCWCVAKAVFVVWVSSLSKQLEACERTGDPEKEGVVFPRLAEIGLLGGLGCGRAKSLARREGG